jgi:hypothetical protein
MRRSLVVVAALAFVAPLGAQGKDPTKAVGSAPLPLGWVMKLDPGSESMTAKFVEERGGFHVTSGGAAIYYAKGPKRNEPFTTMGNFRQAKKNVGHGDHGEAFGLFAGGRDLDDPAKQTYFYFLVRQDGSFLINHRAGKEVHKIVDWTPNPAIVKFDDKPNASNDLEIRVATDSVRFVVNSKVVHAISRKAFSDVSGETGIRVNHNLDVIITNYMVM